MSYKYTVNDHFERIAKEIWDASRDDDYVAFNKCITSLKSLKTVATARSEFAKAALESIDTERYGSFGEGCKGAEQVAVRAFAIADAMLAEEAKSR